MWLFVAEFGLQRVINFPASRKPSERTYLLKTLAGCPIQPERVERLLNITILEQNGNFTENDLFLIFSMLTGGSNGYATLFNFVQQHWDTIKKKYVKGSLIIWFNLVSPKIVHFPSLFSHISASKTTQICGTVWSVQQRVCSPHKKAMIWFRIYMQSIMGISVQPIILSRNRWKTSKKRPNGAMQIYLWSKNGWTNIWKPLMSKTINFCELSLSLV